MASSNSMTMPGDDSKIPCLKCGVPYTARGMSRHVDKPTCIAQAERNRRNNQDPSSQPTATATDQLITSEPLHIVLQKLRASTKVIKRIPKGARMAAAVSLTEKIDAVVDKKTDSAWRNLLVFSYAGLKQPDDGKKKKRNLTSAVKQNLSRQELDLTQASNGNRKKTFLKDAKKKIVEGKMNDGDISGALRVLASDDSVAVPSPQVLDTLKAKHPPEPPDADFPDLPDIDILPLDATAEEVTAAVRSFPNGSAGGVDGLRPQHLKDMLAGAPNGATVALADSLAKLVTIMIRGKVPSCVCEVLYGASLTALVKKDGGIRPIAVGNTLRRLTGKIIGRRVGTPMEQQVRPEQVGCGTKGGAEAAVHAVRCFLQEGGTESQALLKLDFKNAFNTVRRDILLRVVKESMPMYSPFVWQAYRHPSKLLYGQHVLESASGVQQGDPLGPLLFCLVIQKLTKSLSSSLNVWYLDDGTIGGNIESVLSDLQVVMMEGAKLGLELNTSKCELFAFNGSLQERQIIEQKATQACPGILFPSRDALSLLGAPLLEEGLEEAVREKTSKMKKINASLTMLSAHQALFLLKNCLCLPKLLYVLRCSPVWKVPEVLREFDEVVRTSLTEIANTEMTSGPWRQATLPVGLGGLGIRRTEEVALPAFLASTHSVKQLVQSILPGADLDSEVTLALSEWTLLTTTNPPAPQLRHNQKSWDLPLLKEIHDTMVSEASTNTKARLLAVSDRNSGSWLHALPASSLGNLLDDNTLRVSIGLRLGAKLCRPHVCRCGKMVDEYGQHGLSCKFSAGRHSRHSALNESLRRALATAQVPAVLEPPGIFRADKRRPDGMTQIPWKNGKELVWDVTVVDSLALMNVAGSSIRAGTAAGQAEERKKAKYRDISRNFFFCPVGLETFGPWGPSATELFEAVGRKMAEQTGEPRSFQFFKQRVSIDIQRGNSFSVISTVKDVEGLDEVFYVLDVKKGKSSV